MIDMVTITASHYERLLDVRIVLLSLCDRIQFARDRDEYYMPLESLQTIADGRIRNILKLYLDGEVKR